MKNLPRKTLERKLFRAEYQYVCGVDEVGIGCLAGPVVVCAVGIKKDFHERSRGGLAGLKESKLLSASQRDTFAARLMADPRITYAIALCSPRVIDKINIYQAGRLAMRQALQKIQPSRKLKTIVLVDGKHKLQGITHDQQAIVKGDRKIFAIACASIIAKVHRDRLMATMDKRYPGYDFAKHKGYGTPHHQARLAKLGPCAIHRKSFAPVAKMI